MSEDSRCCGTGTCIINSDGECWCGQRWDGERMCFPEPTAQERHPSHESSGDSSQTMNKPD